MPVLGGCLCFDLPTGTKIIGGIYIFVSIIYTLFLAVLNIAVWGFDFIYDIIKALKSDHKLINSDLFKNIMEDTPELQKAEDRLEHIIETLETHVEFFKIMCLVILVLAFLCIITSSMLIHGVRKRCRCLLLPWVVQEVIHIIVAIVIIIMTFVIAGVIQETWAIVVPLFVMCCIQVYFILVVLSQYQALELIRMQDEICMK